MEVEEMKANLNEFKIVNHIPTGDVIWNIGKNMVEGYIPFVSVGGHDGYQVIKGSKKAYKFDKAQDILSITGYGIQNSKDAEKAIEKYSQKIGYEDLIERIKKAIPLFKELGL